MRLVIGRVLRPHGVRGEVVVDIATDSPQQRFQAGTALATDPESAGPLHIEAVRPHQGRLLVTFTGYADRDQALQLRGVALCVDSADVEPLGDPDEFHDFELIGLTARDEHGQALGEVVQVRHGPGADLLVVRLTSGRDALVPFVSAIVPAVDVAAGQLVVTPPDGLFDL